MTEKLIMTNLENGIGELVLNRPDKRNSIIGPLVTEMDKAIQEMVASDSCNVIIIRGEQGYFCAGLDLKAFSEEPAPPWRETFQDDWTKLHNTIYNCPKPIVGALEKFSIAGGSALAFACDFLVVGKGAFLQVAEVEMGLAAPINVAWLNIRYPHALGLQMAVLGERTYGDELLRLGIANQCVEDDQVLKVTRELGRRLADFNNDAVKKLKAGLRRTKEMGDFLQIVQEIKTV